MSNDLLPKYCELYGITETDISAVACNKDNISVKCFFSKHETRSSSTPIQFTFINGQPSNELLPALNEILTQQRFEIDFLIVITFPKNDILTQLSKPIVRKCLSRCLNQYKDSLKRKKRNLISTATIMDHRSTSPHSHQSQRMKYVEDVNDQRDNDDVLYRVSQSDENKQTTFEKCSKWLQTNDFHKQVKTTAPQKLRKSAQHQCETRQKVDFFDIPSSTRTNFRRDAEQTLSKPYQIPSAHLPVPEFYSAQKIFLNDETPKTPLRKKRNEIETENAQRWLQQNKKKSPKPSHTQTSFLQMDVKREERKTSFHNPETCRTQNKLNRFKRNEQKKIPRATKHQKPSHSEPPELTAQISPLINALVESECQDEATTFLNICGENNNGLITFTQLDSTQENLIGSQNPTSRHSSVAASPNNQPAMCNTFPHVFMEPLFLEPRSETDDYIIDSPKARFHYNDLVECYEDYHTSCRKTIQRYKIALERVESDSSDCDCCGPKLINHEIEMLRQPFHRSRNIFSNIGGRKH